MKHKTLLLLTCLNIYGQIGNSQQGGFVGTPSGGFCDPAIGNPTGKTCKTFGEAGVRINSSPKDDKWVIPEDLYKEIYQIISTLPITEEAKRILFDKSFGTSQTFTIVGEKNQKQANAAKEIYIRAFKSFMPQKDLDRIAIFQVSTGSETFVFPDFLSLPLRGRALSMIHEAGVRGRDLNVLPEVLEYDGLIYDWLTRDPSRPITLGRFYRFVDLTISLYLSEFEKKLEPYRAREFTKLLASTGTYFHLNDFCEENNSPKRPSRCLINRAQVLKFAYTFGIHEDHINEIRPMDFSFIYTPNYKVINLVAHNLAGGEAQIETICSMGSKGHFYLVGFQLDTGTEIARGVGLAKRLCDVGTNGQRILMVHQLQ